MCLAVPGRLVKVDGKEGTADIMGVRRKVNLHLIDEAKEGDWIIIHVGFAIQKIGKEEALETLRLLEELTKSA